MQPFGAGFGQAVGQGLEHDGVVVVVRGLELGQLGFDADAGGNGEGTDVVRRAGRSDEIQNRRMELIGENIRRFAKGEPLLNVVDKKKGY